MSDYEQKYFGTLPVLPVADVGTALGHYTEQLGFEEVFSQQDDRGAVVNAQVQMDDCHLMLNLNPARANDQGGGVYFWIRVRRQPIDELYEQLITKGIVPVEPISDQFWGDRSFVVQDASGYAIAFTQAKPKPA